MSVNDDILNRHILHLVSLQRQYSSLDRTVQRELDRHTRAIETIVMSNGTVDNKIARIRRESKRAYGTLADTVTDNITKVGVNETKFQRNNLQRSMGSLYTVSGVPTGRLRSLLGNMSLTTGDSTINGTRTFSQWLDGISAKELTAVEGKIRSGFVRGLSPAEVVKEINGVGGGLTRSNASTRALVRTVYTHTQNTAADLLYARNSDILKGYEWLSTLDMRTSGVCRARDGKLYEQGSGVYPPAHFNCRSTTIPIVKELGELPIPQTRKDRLSAKRRASFTGQVPAALDYDSWLRTQSPDAQNEILGVTQADVFRQGNLHISKFTDIYGEDISLNRLQQLDDSIIETSTYGSKYKRGQDVTQYDITTPITSVNDLLANQSALIDLIGAQAHISNVNKGQLTFSSINFTQEYRDYLKRRDGTLFVNRQFDSVTGEVVDQKRVGLDTDAWLNELRLLDDSLSDAKITRKQHRFIADTLRKLELTLEGNQRIVVIRTLRRIFERNDFDADANNINRYLTGFLNSQSRNLTRTNLNESARLQREARGINLTMSEIRSTRSARLRGIANVEKKFLTYANKNALRATEALPNSLSDVDGSLVLQRALQLSTGQLGTDINLAAARLGDYIYNLANVTAPLTTRTATGVRVLDILRTDGRLSYARVIRSPGVNASIDKIEDISSPTRDADFVVIESTHTDSLLYSDLTRQEAIFNNLPKSNSQLRDNVVGSNDVFLQDAYTSTPDRVLTPALKDQLDYVSGITYQLDPDMLRLMEVELSTPGSRLSKLDNSSGGSISRGFEAAQASPNTGFKYDATLDYRLREYINSYISPQGRPEFRSMIDYKRKVEIGQDGFNNLRISVGEYLTDANTFDARFNAADTYETRLIALGKDIAEGNVGNLYNRHRFLNTVVDKDDISYVQRYALEFYRLDNWIRRGRSPETFKSGLIAHDDATASAFQNAALMTRRLSLAESSNVVPTSFAERPYRIVGNNAFERAIVENNFSDARTVELLRTLTDAKRTKTAKYPTMTTIYGAVTNTKITQVRNALYKAFSGVDSDMADIFNNLPDEDITLFGKIVTDTVDAEFPEAGAYHRFVQDMVRATGGDVRLTMSDNVPVIITNKQTITRDISLDLGDLQVNSRIREVLDDDDLRAIASGGPANFTHAYDATINRVTKRLAMERGIDVTSIHDSWGTHIGNRSIINEIVREATVEVYTTNPLRRTLDELLETEQITRQSYDDLLDKLINGVTVNGRTININPDNPEFDLEDVLRSLYYIA